jgi:hypothetical protein
MPHESNIRIEPANTPGLISIHRLAELVVSGQVSIAEAGEVYDHGELFRLVRVRLRRQLIQYIADVVARDVRRNQEFFHDTSDVQAI